MQSMIDVDAATICRSLQRSSFTHQKLCLVALQRDAFLRQKYIQDISSYKPEMFMKLVLLWV